MAERIFAICVGAIFGFLPYAVKGMPTFVAWIGIAGAVLIGGLTFTSINPRLVMPAAFVVVSVAALIAASSWLYQRYQETPGSFPDAIARLAELGWTVKPGQNDVLFEITSAALPPMQESATYFAQLKRPFRLHFQSVKSLDGLHYLADLPECTSIEIGAGEFTDISELRGFTHLTKLGIGQVPLNGLGVVDPAPLSSLVNLQELILGMTRIRDSGFLANLTSLRRLYLGSTLITDISAVSSIHSLEYLDIRGTRVNDLRPLSEEENLTELSVGVAQLPGLVNLAKLKNIKRLMIVDQQEPIDLSTVGLLINLESLFVWGGTHQIDVLPLRNLHQLRSLQLTGNSFGPVTPITNLEAFSEMTNLRTLTIGYVQIRNIDFVHSLSNLTEIALNSMPITSVVPLYDLKALKKISMADVPVVDIAGFLELPNLTELSLIRVPARSDVLSELERRGVIVERY